MEEVLHYTEKILQRSPLRHLNQALQPNTTHHIPQSLPERQNMVNIVLQTLRTRGPESPQLVKTALDPSRLLSGGTLGEELPEVNYHFPCLRDVVDGLAHTIPVLSLT